MEKNEGEWTGKVETRTRKTFLTVGKAWMTISRFTPCFKRRKIFQLRGSQQITVSDLVYENRAKKKKSPKAWSRSGYIHACFVGWRVGGVGGGGGP